MKKTVAFKNPARQPDATDSWVAARGADTEAPATPKVEADVPAEPMKRFTIDVPESLHKRVKVTCATRGLKMADIIREMLERDFPAKKRKSFCTT